MSTYLMERPTMTTGLYEDFERHDLATWTEPELPQRRADVEQLWAAAGRPPISRIGAVAARQTVHGVNDLG